VVTINWATLQKKDCDQIRTVVLHRYNGFTSSLGVTRRVNCLPCCMISSRNQLEYTSSRRVPSSNCSLLTSVPRSLRSCQHGVCRRGCGHQTIAIARKTLHMVSHEKHRGSLRGSLFHSPNNLRIGMLSSRWNVEYELVGFGSMNGRHKCSCQTNSLISIHTSHLQTYKGFCALFPPYIIYSCSLTNRPAIPIPVPMHMVVSRTLALRRRHSLRPVTICLVPVQPRG
jgi:hypothetical protein